MEIWKDVAGYEGYYQVSNKGHVRSVERVVPFGKQARTAPAKERIKRMDKRGYLTVTLSKGNSLKNAKVHRLVAEAFIPNPCNFPEVNHKDENKQNNSVDNLEWCVHIYNAVYGTKLERQRKNRSGPIIQCDADGECLKEYESAKHAEFEINGKFTGNISKCLNGKIKTAFGYIWKFKEVT